MLKKSIFFIALLLLSGLGIRIILDSIPTNEISLYINNKGSVVEADSINGQNSPLDDTVTPTESATLTLTATDTETLLPPTDTATATDTITTTPTLTATATKTITPTPTFTATTADTVTPTPTFTPGHTAKPSKRATDSATPTSSVTPVDTEKPQVHWVSPAGDGEGYFLDNRFVHLVVSATDNMGISRVHFFRWDKVLLSFINIGTVYTTPCDWNFDTTALYYGWDEIDVEAYDAARNLSDHQFIFLYRKVMIYLPFVKR